MNVKIVLAATAFASTLALAAPTLAQDNEPVAPRHHHGVHLAHRRGATSDIDAKEREITRQLNQDQLLAVPRPNATR